MPNKKEIRLLQYLYKSKSRYQERKSCTRKNIETNLSLNNDDLGDMQGSNFLYFYTNMAECGICLTREGNLFVENYCYEKIKKFFLLDFWTSINNCSYICDIIVFKN